MISREKYWCTIPVSVPWRSTGHFRDLRIWLLDNVLSMDYDYVGMDREILPNQDNRVYYFAREEDAMMFSLRWS
jgi:hypothetical protein